MLTTVAYSLAIYVTSHYIIRYHLRKRHERVGRVLFRVAASLLALILSITFANQRVEYFELKRSIGAEASALVDIKIDLDLYDTEASHLIQTKIRDYVLSVSEDGWKSIYENPFKSKSVGLFLEIYSDINHLETKTHFHESLKSNLLDDIDRISDYLQIRLYSIREKSSPLIYTSIFGLAAIMILFSVYRPDRITIGFLSIYSAFIGIVLYFILMMSNPLKGPLQIEPGPFNLLKETIESNY
jgi:hypothetical protein